jgi:hypothetical protein
MKRTAAILILLTAGFFSVPLLAQETLEAAKPVVILNPGHNDFVIPPFFIEGRAEPGEKLGLFVNGYPHQVVIADARGRFLERVAWTHGGAVWVEIRRGDERRHAVQLRVANVTPGVGNRILASAAPSLKELHKQTPPKLLPVRSDSSTLEASPDFVHQFVSPIRDVPNAQRHMVSIASGLSAQLIAISAMSALNYDPGKNGHAPSLILMSMSMQTAIVYLIHQGLGGEPNRIGMLLGAALPTAVSLLGFATDSTALTVAGMAAQPVGATFGATF